MKTCPSCGSPLMRIEYYGEVLVGCIECNRWGRSGDKKSQERSAKGEGIRGTSWLGK